MSSIKLSPEYGVNPAVPLCYFCLEEKGEVILAGRMKGDREAPRKAVWNMEPCDTCKGYMETGIILISVDESKTTDRANPYRTGGFCVIKEKVISEMLHEDAAVDILEQRYALVPDEIWDGIGLPKLSNTEEKEA